MATTRPKDTRKRTLLSVECDPDLRTALRIEAIRRGTTVAAIVTSLVRRELEQSSTKTEAAEALTA